MQIPRRADCTLTEKNKNPCKWTWAVQTPVVQESTSFEITGQEIEPLIRRALITHTVLRNSEDDIQAGALH